MPLCRDCDHFRPGLDHPCAFTKPSLAHPVSGDDDASEFPCFLPKEREIIDVEGLVETEAAPAGASTLPLLFGMIAAVSVDLPMSLRRRALDFDPPPPQQPDYAALEMRVLANQDKLDKHGVPVDTGRRPTQPERQYPYRGKK